MGADKYVAIDQDVTKNNTQKKQTCHCYRDTCYRPAGSKDGADHNSAFYSFAVIAVS